MLWGSMVYLNGPACQQGVLPCGEKMRYICPR